MAPKLYATILLKLFLNFHQHYHRKSKCNCRIHIVVSELVANLNISENKRVVRDMYLNCVVQDALKMINYLTLTLVKLVAYPDILQNASRNKENDN